MPDILNNEFANLRFICFFFDPQNRFLRNAFSSKFYFFIIFTESKYLRKAMKNCEQINTTMKVKFYCPLKGMEQIYVCYNVTFKTEM